MYLKGLNLYISVLFKQIKNASCTVVYLSKTLQNMNWRFMGIDSQNPELNFVKSESNSKCYFDCLSWKLHTEKDTLDKQTEVFSFLLEPWSIHVVCKSDRATNNIKKTHKWSKTCKTIKENMKCKIRRIILGLDQTCF